MTKTIVTIAHNAVIAQVRDEPSREVKLLLQQTLSYAVAGAEHVTSFKSGHWDGRSSFFEFKSATFPAGFVYFVAARLRHAGYEPRIVKHPLPEPLGPERPVVDAFPEDPNYEFQMRTVDTLVKHGQIIAQIATGGGKSRTARLAFARINRPTLFLTTRGILMYQMRDTFEKDLGVGVSVLGDGQFGHTMADGRRAVKKMCVGMVQTLVARLEEKTLDGEVEAYTTALAKRELKAVNALEAKLKKAGVAPAEIARQAQALEKKQERERMTMKELRQKLALKVHEHMAERAKTIALLGTFELVILEEAHEVSGDSYYTILRHCKKAFYRLALTATPFMKGDEEANMRLMAVSGPIAIRVSEETLIDRGILAQPHFTIVQLRTKPKHLNRSTSWAAAYRLGITDNELRNGIAVQRCALFARYGLTSMMLVQHTAHGDAMKLQLEAAGLRVEFIRGEDDQDGRKAALAGLASGSIDVLIGTTILDVGVDVPAVGHVCLLGGGKAEVALRQRIGRGLRRKKSGPNICFVTDFADAYNDHLREHARQRLSIIKSTAGFDRFVYENGADVNLEALGFTALPKAA
jgi:superfamily II DNA or RNA helicase